jgi:hypothetical protein
MRAHRVPTRVKYRRLTALDRGGSAPRADPGDSEQSSIARHLLRRSHRAVSMDAGGLACARRRARVSHAATAHLNVANAANAVCYARVIVVGGGKGCASNSKPVNCSPFLFFVPHHGVTLSLTVPQWHTNGISFGRTSLSILFDRQLQERHVSRIDEGAPPVFAPILRS